MALAIAITLLAGIIKGAIGFAMPLVMVSGISSLVDPKLALAAIIMPIVVSNIWQTFRAGWTAAVEAARDFWRYVVVVCVTIFAVAQLVPIIPTRIFYLVLGVPVVTLSMIQLLGVRFSIEEEQRRWAEWLAGIVSGVFGGLAGTWGPTTVLYLLAINTPKTRQIVIQGVLYGVGSVSLLLAHLQSGILNAASAPLSIALVVPAMLGMWLGFQIHDRLDQDRFRQITLIVLVIAGLNLLRRGLFG